MSHLEMQHTRLFHIVKTDKRITCQTYFEATLRRSRKKRQEKISILIGCGVLYDTDRLGSNEALWSPILLCTLYLYGTPGNFHSGPRSSGGNLYISATGFEGFTDISILTASLVG